MDLTLKDNFNKVIQYSQNISEPQTDELLKKWRQAKKDFIFAFGNKLIYEFPETITFELSQQEKEENVRRFCEEECDNEELIDFILNNKDGFFKNLVVDGNNIIPKGMKLLKAFKFFEKDKTKLEKLQAAASMVIQKNKIEGTFCLSVHPLDFLSASENCHNWRSCHALDGDFRTGNLSYMLDSCTIMCYLKSKDDVVLPNFPEDVKWNNKKWRMWLHFSDNQDMIFAGRQYPFFTSGALDFLRDKILASKELKFAHKWTQWSNKKITEWNGYTLDDKYLAINNHLIGMHELVIDNPGSLHYNDLLYSSFYDPYYIQRMYEPLEGEDLSYWFVLQKKPITKITSRFRLGNRVKCLRCGEKYIEESQTMMCPDCELKYGTELSDDICECAVCGERLYVDDAIWIEDPGDWVCQDCASREVSSCELCGEYCYTSDMIWDEKISGYICQNCGEGEY